MSEEQIINLGFVLYENPDNKYDKCYRTEWYTWGVGRDNTVKTCVQLIIHKLEWVENSNDCLVKFETIIDETTFSHEYLKKIYETRPEMVKSLRPQQLFFGLLENFDKLAN